MGGYIKSVLRVHLGLAVPFRCCKLYVSPDSNISAARAVGAAFETAEWEEGRLLTFDDTMPHYVENTGTEDRIILLLDVVRPELMGFLAFVKKDGMDRSGFSSCASKIEEPSRFTS